MKHPKCSMCGGCRLHKGCVIVKAGGCQTPNIHTSWLVGREELRLLGITVVRRHGEFRVNFRGGKEGTAYYTNDMQDAIDTGKAMAREVQK